MKKSQASVEFLIATGFILVIFIFLLWFIAERNDDLKKTGQYLDEKNLCLKLSNNINGALVNGDGARIDMPISYKIQVSNRSLYVGPDNVACSFIAGNASNTTHSIFSLAVGNIRVKNQNDAIIIKNV